MVADGAAGGDVHDVDDIPAVQTHPGLLGRACVESALLQSLCQPGKALGVGLLDLGDLPEGVGHGGEALFLGGLGKVGIDGFKFLQLIMLRPAEKIGHLIGDIHGIGSVDGDVGAGELFHVVVEDLGVLFLLVGGEVEHGLQEMKLLLLADACGEGVAVAGLGFSGKSPHKVDQGFGVRQIHKFLLGVWITPVGCGGKREIMQGKPGNLSVARLSVQIKGRIKKREKIMFYPLRKFILLVREGEVNKSGQSFTKCSQDFLKVRPAFTKCSKNGRDGGLTIKNKGANI